MTVVERWILIALAASFGLAAAQEPPAGQSLAQEAGMDVEAPANGFSLVHGLLEFRTTELFPPHVHGGPALYTVIQGRVQVHAEDGSRGYRAGESYVQEAGEVVSAEHAGHGPAHMAVAFVLPAGEELTTFHEAEGRGQERPAPTMLHDLALEVTAPAERFRVVQRVVDVEAGARGPLHASDDPVLVTVLDGPVLVSGAEDQEQSIAAGDGFTQEPGQRLEIAAGDAPARFVMTYLQAGAEGAAASSR